MLGAIFAQTFREFRKVLWDFVRILEDFAWILWDFTRIFPNQNFWGCGCTPFTPLSTPAMTHEQRIARTMTTLAIGFGFKAH